jgi:hypothetical protein
MAMVHSRLVTSLAAIAGAMSPLAAEQAAAAMTQGRPVHEVGRQVFVKGLVDLDYVSQNNYSDGNDDARDHLDQGWIRAELGARIEMDERVKVITTLAYDAEDGDDTFVDGDSSDPNQGQVVMDDAYVVLTDFLDKPNLMVQAGRQPESWNLRKDYGAFLFDSRANDPDVTSWDGVKGMYKAETVKVSPYLYQMPDASRLIGVAIDWTPAEAENSELFLTGSINKQDQVTLNSGGTGDTLWTYYGGAEVRFFDRSIVLYGEGAMQNGDETSDVEFSGYGFNVGLDWHPTSKQMLFGVQLEYLSGDEDPADSKNRAFVNTWEGESETYIVENEKYGEVSGFLDGNLQAIKGKTEIAVDRMSRFLIKAAYGFYQTTEDTAGGNDEFGQEGDLTFTVRYADCATFNLFGAVFLPDAAFEDVAPGATPSMDSVYLFGLNLQVVY